jgi:hypothetical protein
MSAPEITRRNLLKSVALGAAGATLNPGALQRIAVMSGGKVAYLTEGANADRTTIGRHMAGH